MKSFNKNLIPALNRPYKNFSFLDMKYHERLFIAEWGGCFYVAYTETYISNIIFNHSLDPINV